MQSIFFCVHMHMLRVSGGMTMPRVWSAAASVVNQRTLDSRLIAATMNLFFYLLKSWKVSAFATLNLWSELRCPKEWLSPGTLQRILYSAHAKVAEALCCGKGIFINGGHYEIAETCCNGKAVCRNCRFLNKNNSEVEGDAEVWWELYAWVWKLQWKLIPRFQGWTKPA